MRLITYRNVCLVLAAFAVLSCVLPGLSSEALALVTCPTSSAIDSDADGFSDAQECGGISFGGVTYVVCAGGSRELCVDPNTKDVFFYVVTPSGSLVIANAMNATTNATPAQFLFKELVEPRTATASGKIAGLGLGVHVRFVASFPAERNIPSGPTTTPQQAIVLIEDLSPSAVFGLSDVGTPSNTGQGRIYTQAIKDNVNLLMGNDAATQYRAYFQHTFSHEAGHIMALTAKKDSTIGYHYSTKSTVMMSESVTFASRTKTFQFPTDFASGDNPCLLVVDTSNPLNCLAFPPPPIIVP